MVEKMMKFKRLSISTAGGDTMTTSQLAKNLSEAIEQELKYYDRVSKIPAQINLEEEE